MNKKIKIICILLIVILLVMYSNKVFAIQADILNKLDSGKSSDMGEIQTKAGTVLKTLRNISAIIAVFVITILGIKYMMGSVEEKAGYKKSFIPLVVGIAVVVSATTIATMLFDMGSGGGTSQTKKEEYYYSHICRDCGYTWKSTKADELECPSCKNNRYDQNFTCPYCGATYAIYGDTTRCPVCKADLVKQN